MYLNCIHSPSFEPEIRSIRVSPLNGPRRVTRWITCTTDTSLRPTAIYTLRRSRQYPRTHFRFFPSESPVIISLCVSKFFPPARSYLNTALFPPGPNNGTSRVYIVLYYVHVHGWRILHIMYTKTHSRLFAYIVLFVYTRAVCAAKMAGRWGGERHGPAFCRRGSPINRLTKIIRSSNALCLTIIIVRVIYINRYVSI